MMKSILNLLLGRKRVRVVEMSELCETRLTVTEVAMALKDARQEVRVQALLQLVCMTRQNCVNAAQDAAWKGGNAAYHLGGAEALNDLLGELAGLLEGKPVSDEVKGFFKPAR